MRQQPNAAPGMNGKGPTPPEVIAAAQSAQPEGPYLEIEGGRKVALTSEEALRLELLETQTKLFDAQMQLITRAKQEASTRGQEIIAAAIARDKQQQQEVSP
jgi:hypothetical protein